MLHEPYEFLLISMTVAVLSETITRSSIGVFKPLRIYKLFRCPYCLSHWIAIPFSLSSNFVVQWGAIVCVSSIFGYVIEQYLKEIEYGIGG